MKLTTIPTIYRNVKRWSEIIGVLSRYGLADWLSYVNIDFVKDALKNRDGEILARHTRETRIRMALTDLGPTFIKLGQLLSTRPDIAGVALAEELRQLQRNVPADPPARVRETVQSELGESVDDVYAEFDDVAIASASIGQVHLARLHTGERVVVKVQHAGIESTVQEDLEVMAGLAQLADHIPELAQHRPKAVAAELARTLRREIDFGIEERNLQQFATMLSGNASVKIPGTYPELSTSRVLTMELLEGIKLSDSGRLIAEGHDPTELARRGAELYLQMIFTHGFFHADPHPGNILILPGNTIGLLDFGMVGRIDERLREDIEAMLLAIVNRDVQMLVTLIRRVGKAPPNLDVSALSVEVADFVGAYATQSLVNFDLSGALNEMVEIMRRYHIALPPQISLLIKTLVTLEGTARLLNPEFSLVEVMQPFHRTMLLRRLSPARQARKLRRLYMEIEHLAEIMPGRIVEIFDQIQSGKFDVHLDHRGLEPSVNRLVLGMLASALFLGSAWMLAQRTPPLLFPENNWYGLHQLSLLGLLGCIAAILIGFRLTWAIRRSGHLDRRRE